MTPPDFDAIEAECRAAGEKATQPTNGHPPLNMDVANYASVLAHALDAVLPYARACQKMLAKHQHCEIDFPSSGCPECEWGHGLHAPDCELARLIGPAK